MASNVPPAPATEEAIVDCVAFFYEEGKGGENFRKKNKFRCKMKREEACRSLRIVFGKSIDNPGGVGGTWVFFWAGMCRPGLQIGTPF